MREQAEQVEGQCASEMVSPLEVSCPHCGRVYRIGENAWATSMLEVFDAMPPVDRPTVAEQNSWFVSSPHKVRYMDEDDPDEAETKLTRTIMTVELIRKLQRRGMDAAWYCIECGNESEPVAYPKSGPDGEGN